MRVLLAVVDPALRALWDGVLADHGHEVIATTPDLQGWETAQRVRPDLAVVELPGTGTEALELCRRLRRPGYEPRPNFMVLVHPDQAEEMVAALRTGADDVLVAQGDRRSALAHLTALERRRGATPQDTPTAHQLAVGYELQALAPRPAAAADPAAPAAPAAVTRALDTLASHLGAARREAEGGSRGELDAALGTLADLRRALGISGVPAASPAGAASATILLVDDEPSVRHPMRMALQHCGYRVVEAADGEEGLGLLARRGPEFALVVLDQRMPRITGTEVLRELRRRDLRIPVVLMSGHPMDDGAPATPTPDAFLAKPFSLADLMRTVQRLIEPEVAAAS